MANIIEFNSDEGQRLLQEVFDNKWPCQNAVINSFGVQVGRSACGIRSSAMVVNGTLKAQQGSADNSASVLIGSAESQSIVSEKSLIDLLVNSGWTTIDRFMPQGAEGMSLDELGVVLPKFACTAVVNHASESSVEKFREDSRKALSSDTKGVIVNYKQDVLGQAFPYGHISPIAAYHEQEDRFLILDTWPESSVVWAKSEPLFEAMNTIDGTCGKTRGYVILTVDVLKYFKQFA